MLLPEHSHAYNTTINTAFLFAKFKSDTDTLHQKVKNNQDKSEPSSDGHLAFFHQLTCGKM